MADLIVWYALTLAGAAIVAAGLVAIALSRRTSAGEHAGWEEHLPELDALRQAPTTVLPAVPEEPHGRHWYPGTAEDSGAIPRHGWREGEQ